MQGSLVCGGSVISHNKALTAAHCDIRKNDDSFQIRVGGEGVRDGKKFPITNTFRHENFTRGSSNNPINDLMIVEFYNPDQKLGAWAPRLNNISAYPTDNAVLTASGYGRLASQGNLPGHLRSVNVPVVSQTRCQLVYPDVTAEENICAGNDKFDSCQGDSGGPLWERAAMNASEILLLGVVSYGYGCASPNAPGVYTRVSGYADWIESILALPDTNYVAPSLPLWKIVVIVAASTLLAVTVVTLFVIFVVRRRRKGEFSERGGDDS